MEDAAMIATVDIGKAYAILCSLSVTAEAFKRGMRHVHLAYLAQCRDGERTNRVERMVRVGFRKIARYAATIH